ncbi:transglutaminase domain-containing protein, partial [Piscinibacter sp.]|uniref:transglutaminase domain-containing protein n=1 Tax=Piscinibacter sp. TaxID=1903157 RepID=UPI002BAC5143
VSELFVQLPDSLPQRVADLAATIIAEAGADNPYDAAVALETYLRTLPYDLTVPAAPPGEDTVDYFLFTLQRGYFDYHASALAVMLRSAGIPARVAVGYAIDAEDVKANGTFRIQKNDAYTWVEVFFPQYGWVVFNPTPDRPAGSGSEGAGAGVPGDAGLDGADEPSLEEIFDELGGFTGLPGGEVGDSLTETAVDAPAPFPWWIAWTLAGAMTVAALLALSGRLAFTWGTGGLAPRAKHWARVQRVGHWAGLRAEPEETATEWGRRVGTTVQKEDAARALVRAYEQERYGRKDLDGTDDEESTGAYRELRNRLFRRVVRRRERYENGEGEHEA